MGEGSTVVRRLRRETGVLVALSWAIAVVGCGEGAPRSPGPSLSADSPLAARIVGEVLGELAKREAGGVRGQPRRARIVVWAESSSRARSGPSEVEMSESDLEEEWKSLRAEWPDLRRETWLSMRDGAGVVDLRRLLGFPPEVIYVDRGDAEALFEQGTDPGWERFRERWPSASGLATVSLVGFSPAGDQALLYVEFQSGSDAGYGWYHFRKESEDGRTIDDTWMVWVS